MPSMAVARQGYKGFQKNTRVVITGLRNRILAGATAYLPRNTLLGIVKHLQSPK